MVLEEKCAVFGIRSKQDVFDQIYYGLYSLQHRGQESAGVAVFDGKEVQVIKEAGLVSDTLKDNYLPGKAGIGHFR